MYRSLTGEIIELRKLRVTILLILLAIAWVRTSTAQTGPGGVGTTDGSSSLQLWLQSNKGVEEGVSDPAESGDLITAWRDQSGHGRDATVSGSAPTYNVYNGIWSVDFSAGAVYLNNTTSGPITGTQARTMIVVARPTSLSASSSNSAVCLSPNSATGRGYHLFLEGVGASSGLSLRVSGNKAMNYAISTTQPTIFSTQSPAGANVTATVFYANGTQQTTLVTQSAAVMNSHNSGYLLGGYATATTMVSAGSFDYNGDLYEVMSFSEQLNNADRILVENYLGAKYGIALGNDFFNYEISHKHEVAGIGRVDASNLHTASRSANILEISGATDLGDGEFLLFGHDSSSIASWTATEVLNGDVNMQRISREWRFTETGEVGDVTLTVDVADLPSPSAGYVQYGVLIDSDGNFTSGATFYPLTHNSGTLYELTALDIVDGDFVTIVAIRPEVQLTSTSARGFEAAGPYTIQLSLNYPLSFSTDISFSENVTSTATGGGTDYSVTGSPVTIAAGSLTQDITLIINDEGIAETDETIIIDISGASASVNLGANVQYIFTINDDDIGKAIYFQTATGAVDEDVSPAQVTIEMSSTDGLDATVDYTITGGTATNGSIDYNLSVSGTAIIAAGNTTTTLDIIINDDALDEEAETIIIELSNPGPNVNLGAQQVFTLDINDNDSPVTVQFNSPVSGSSEAYGSGFIEVSLTGVSGHDVTVPFTVADGTATGGGTDYTLADGTLTIPAGSMLANIPFPITNDVLIEGGETFTVTLGIPTNALLGNPSVHTKTISDDDNNGYTGPGGVGNASNNVLWLIGDSGVYNDAGSTLAGNNEAVQEWHDMSGNSNNFTMTTAMNRPGFKTGMIGGHSVICFDGVNHHLIGPSLLSGNVGRSIFMVSKATTIGGSWGGCMLNLNYPQTGTNGAQFSITPEMATRVNGNRVFNESMGTSNFRLMTVNMAAGANVTGIDMYLESTIGTELSSSAVAINTGSNGSIIGYSDHVTEHYNGDFAEIIVYNNELNSAQRRIVQNYLAAKYKANINLSATDDKYAFQTIHGTEVAGIGRDNASNQHTAAQSAGILKISSPSGLEDGDYLLFGHDNTSIASWNTTDVPTSGNIQRLTREWRLDESESVINDGVGTVTITIDTTKLPARPAGYSNYYIMIDADGNFASGAALYPMQQIGSTASFEVNAVDISDQAYLAIAVVRSQIKFANTTSSAFEPNSPKAVQISLNYPVGTDVTVQYAATGGTATGSGIDYTLAAGTATITAGNTTTNINITLINDIISESTETIELKLSNPSANIALGADSVHIVSINDDDNARKIDFSAPSSNGDEGVSPVTLTIEIPLAQVDAVNPTTVNYSVTGGTATGGGVDFTLASGTATIAATESSITFDIVINEDALDEADETIIITLSDPTNSNLGTDNVYTYTIQDNDSEPAVQFTSTGGSGSEGVSPANIEVQLTGISGQDITVDYAVAAITATHNIDYVLANGTLTIPAGSQSAFLYPVINEDALIEGGETFSITISNPAGASLGANTVHVFTISDNDNQGYVGPGGVGDDNNNVLWLIGDSSAYSDAGTTLAGNGEAITEWHDLSGNSNDFTQSSASAKPALATGVVNGHAVVRFDGSSDFLTGSSILSGNGGRTIFFISKASALAGTYGGTMMSLNYPKSGATGAEFSISPEVAVRVSGNRVFNESLGTSGFRLMTVDLADGANITSLNMYLESTLGTEASSSAATINTGGNGSALGFSDHLSEYFNGDFAEVLVYNQQLNSAQRKIVWNYLWARYFTSFSLSASDTKYSYQASYPHNLAGIGRDDAGNEHLAAQSAGILTVSSPSSLEDGDYLLFGHNNASITSWTTMEAPHSGVNYERITREWRMDESETVPGDGVGTISVTIDTTYLAARSPGYNTFVLLVDADGDFSNGAMEYPMTSLGGSEFEASGVAVADGDFMTIAVARSVIEFTSTISNQFEPTSPGTVEISLNFPTSSNISVNYTVTGGTATGGGTDYVLANGTATITAGNTTTNINITMVNDVLVEPDETIVIGLSDPTNGAVLGANTTNTFTINDDDNSRKINFTASSSAGDEGVSPVTLTVQINTADASNPTTVNYSVTGGTATGGTDYTLAAGTATIPAGVGTTTTFDIVINEDMVDEADETIIISLSSPTNCNLAATNKVYTYTIQDNDTEPTIEFTSIASDVDEDVGTVSLEVNLTAASGQNVMVDYAVSGGTATGGGSDYTLVAGTLTIPAGSETGNINVAITNDATIESLETIIIDISNPTGAALGGNTSATITIYDDDSNDGYTGPGGVGGDDGSTSLKLWLKGDDGVIKSGGGAAVNGDNIASWEDRSGNGIDMAKTGSFPVFRISGGISYVDFSGGSKYLVGSSAISGTTARTLITVVRPLSLASSASNCAVSLAPNAAAGAGYGLMFESPGASTGMGLRVSGNKMMNYTTSTAAPTIISAQSGASANITATQYYANGTALSTVAAQSANTLNTSALGTIVGGFSTGADIIPESAYDFNGYVYEVLAFSKELNTAERLIIENYLGAKYGLTIGVDMYDYQATHGYDVVGIGRADASNIHAASESADILKIDNASAMGDGEYLFFGHDNGDATTWTTTEALASSQRLAREWKVDETGDIGTVKVTVDMTMLPAMPGGFNNFVLMIDVDGDDDFTTGSVDIYPLSNSSGSLYTATGVNVAANYTIGIAAVQNVTQSSGNYNNPGTWLAGLVPASGQEAIIDNGDVVTLSANQTVGALTINGTGTFNLSSYTLTVDNGTITNNGSFNPGTGKVIYSAAADQSIAVLNYYKITLSGSGTKTLTGNIDVESDLQISSAGVTLDVSASNYNINLGGNWNNNGTFTPRSGTVTFDGSGTQTLTASTTQTFNNLTVSKGSGNLSLARNITVNGTLDMSAGNLQLGSLTLTLGSSCSITNGGASSYIQADGVGVIKKMYSAVPAATLAIPMGDADDYSPFTFTLQDATLSGGAYVTFKVTDSKHPNLTGTTDFISRYWVVTPYGISCNGTCDAGSGDISYDMSYVYVDADVNGDESQYTAMKYSGGNWLTGGSVNVGANTLTWNGVTSFSEMTGGDGGEVLPIKLLYFDAQLVNDSVQLNWKTATEINNHFFTVERSKDGINFEVLGKVEGAGNSSTMRSYAAVDAYPYEGLSYYRLKQTDYDGRTETFSPVPVNNSDGTGYPFITIFPNPAKTSTYVMIEQTRIQEEEVLIVLQDMLGKTYYSKVVLIGQTKTSIVALDMLGRLKPGLYMVTASSRYGIESQRLIVEP
ncbi:MAG: T9SS type A sorting domain-containing protein [Flavobacteriales bacterium]|nr:T9SS type A sorting domain-containing protein [Flavobacteriales bacterium]